MDKCLQNIEIVTFIKNDLYFNIYNSDRRNHPNFGWGGLGQLQQGQQTCHYGGGRSEAHGYHHGHHNAMPHYSHPQQNQANIASSSSPMENIVKEHI